jgi:hypothetical protein
MSNKNLMTVMCARNGFTVRTRSGIYICPTMKDLMREVESYAKVMQKEAANAEQESE